MIRKTDIKYVDNLRGGNGTIEMRHIISKEELMGHGSMFAHVIIPPYGSIGFHQHVDNTEPYYIIKGEGIFVDNDGSRTPVKTGDVCIIEVGQGHAMENPNEEPLEMIALIYNKTGKCS